MREIIVIVLAVIGLAFSLSAVVGILRMPDVYSRIQCSSKTITMGALPALIALVVAEGPVSAYGSRALVIAALILVVNPGRVPCPGPCRLQGRRADVARRGY